MRYRTKTIEVDAVEWTGENLREVQEFMAPASPLDHAKDQLGINVHDPAKTYGQPTKLAFFPPGSMIVKDHRGLTACAKEEFETLYEPDETITAITADTESL